MKRLDAYAHVLPPKYFARVSSLLGDPAVSRRVQGYHPWFAEFPALVDLDARWRLLDGIDDCQQILVPAIPPVEELAAPGVSADLARLANDEMGDLVRTDPDRFAGFAACLPLNDVDASVAELERAVVELGALGAQLYTNVEGLPLDDPRFTDVFDYAAQHACILWLHPTRGMGQPDYEPESSSKFGLWWSLGWLNESSLAMARLVYSGLFERHPDLAIITHHGGAMVPQFSDRLAEMPATWSPEDRADSVAAIEDRLRRYYADTVVGFDPALRCAIEFFGTDHILFGTDMPFGSPTVVADKIAQIEQLGLAQDDLEKVFSGNAERLIARRRAHASKPPAQP